MKIEKYTNSLIISLLVTIISIIWITPVFSADVSDYVTLNKGRLYGDRRTGINYFSASLTNISDTTIIAPFRVIISSITHPSVTAYNPDGYTEDNQPYFEFQSPSTLEPGAETESRQWEFFNPERKRFNFQIGRILGETVFPPTVDISATPDSIDQGDSSFLYWHSTNAETVTIDQNIGIQAINGCYNDNLDNGNDGSPYYYYDCEEDGDCECGPGATVSPQLTTTYTITATGPGGTATDSVTVTVSPPLLPPTVEISADLESIDPGNSSFLYWHSTNAETVTIDQNIGIVAINGCYNDNLDNGNDGSPYYYYDCEGDEECECGPGVIVSPQSTTTYTIIATGPEGTATDSVTIAVNNNAPMIDFYPGSSSIFQGESTRLYWNTTKTETVEIDQGIGAVALNSGENGFEVSPTTTTTYTITATGSGGVGSVSITIIVLESLLPLVDIIVFPETLQLGEDTALAWSSKNADSIKIESSLGTVYQDLALNSGPQGMVLIPETTTTYTITASGPGGVTTDSATVKVLPSFSVEANPNPIKAGDPCILTLNTINADSVTINQGIDDVDLTAGAPYHHSASITLNPVENTTYTITATGAGGTTEVTVQVTVEPKVTFHVENDTVKFGQPTVFHWSTIYTETVSFEPSTNSEAFNSQPGGFEVFPLEDTTYILTATGPGGVTTQSVTVTVDAVSDVQATDLQVDTSGCYEHIDINLHVNNIGETRIPEGLSIAFYNGDPQSGGTLIGSTKTATELPFLTGSEDIAYRWQTPSTGFADIFAVIDDDGTGNGMYAEGDESNNIISMNTMLCDPITNSGISGSVIDALNGDLLSAIQVILYKDENGIPGDVIADTTTDNKGIFLFTDLEEGSYIIAVDLPGYIDNNRQISLVQDEILPHQDMVFSPVLEEDEIRIILTWGDTPADLEAHLTAPGQAGCRYHAYYWNKNIPMASLNLDDQNSYGPETITITEKITGTYRFYVHNFSSLNGNTTNLARSGAEVKVYFKDRDPAVFTVPNGYGNVWHVFDLDGTSGEIIPVRNMSNQSEPGRIDYPVFTSPISMNGRAYLDTPYSYQVNAADPDNDTLTFSLMNEPEGMTIDPGTGLIEWTPTGTQSGWYTATIKVEDGRCGEATQQHRFHVQSQPTIQFTVDPCSGYNPGGNITLSWEITLADSIVIDQGIGSVQSSGSITIPSPAVPTVYTLTAMNNQGAHTKSVPAKPTAEFYFSPGKIKPGESTTLYWNTNCANQASIDHNIGTVPGKGSIVLTPTSSETYTLDVGNAKGTSKYYASFSFLVNNWFDISPKCNLTPGAPLTLSWHMENATSVSISPDIGEVGPSGFLEVNPTQAGKYKLTASGNGNTINREIYFPDYPSSSFESYPSSMVDSNGNVTLKWFVKCADTVSIDQGIGEVDPIGSLVVNPETLPATYTLTAVNERGPRSWRKTIIGIPPRGSFTADRVILKPGDSTTLSWTTSLADTCTITPDIGSVDLNGSMVVTPSKSTNYTLIIAGSNATVYRSVSVGYIKPIANIMASASTINEGESTTLSWMLSNAGTCTVDQGIGEVEPGGSLIVAPVTTTTYTITASGPGGVDTDKITINVIPANPLPVINLSVNKNFIFHGESVTLDWNSEHTQTVVITPDMGSVDVNGTRSITPEGTTTYIATATGPGGTSTAIQTVNVFYPWPTMVLQATPSDIIEGDSVELSWDSTNASRISFNQGIGVVPLKGTLQVTPGTTTTYSATITGPGGTITRDVTVVVNPRPELQLQIDSPTTFYTSLIQVSGQVTNNAEVIVNGVAATVHGESFTADVPIGTEGKHTLLIEAIDNYGQQESKEINIYYFNIPFVTISSDKYRIAGGESVTLSWSAENCENATLEPGIGDVTCNDSITLPITETTEFTIRSTRAGRTARASVVIVVDDPYGDPSPEEQAHLEAINRARANPSAEAALLNIDLNEGPPSTIISEASVPPLRFNEKLLRAARGHTRDMIDNQDPAQEGSDGSTHLERCQAEGYEGGTGENIAYRSNSAPVDSVETVLGHHDDLFIDHNCPGRGHRVNMLVPDYKEIGVGFYPETCDPGFDYGGTITCNFGDPSDAEPSILGVIYEDKNSNLLYDPDEGLENVLITDLESGGRVYTASAGGYSLPLSTGEHTIQIMLPDGRRITKQVIMAGKNIKHDFRADLLSGLPAQVSLSGMDQAIRPGESTRLIWQSSHATSVEIDSGIGYVPKKGSITVHPAETTTYTITATGPSGTVTSEITVVVTDFSTPPIIDFKASPDTITLGQSTTLSWSTENSQGVHIDNGIGDVLLNDTLTVSPQETTTYTITTSGPTETTTSELTVYVNDFSLPPAIDFTASPNAIMSGESTFLSWSIGNALTAHIDNGIGDVPMNSSLSVSPRETTIYTITASGPAGTMTWEISVYVINFSILPTIDFIASPGTVGTGESTTLSWNVENALNVHIDQGIGRVEQSGSISITPDHTTTYTLTANSPKGVVNEKIRVYVKGHPETQPAGSFGEIYNSLIPADSTMAFYDPERFGLITGQILDISNTPLSGINVTILGHPEYGTAITDTEGRYSIPVEGGNTVTVSYTLDTYLFAQRQVYVPVNDVGIAEIVQLLQEDPLSTDITLDGSSDTVITHKSSVISDAFGERSISMVFQGDNRAYIVDENGDDIQEINSFTTRATEYQTPESMPAKLPGTSAFTYCAELSADGVDRIRFENPVITWVDNFLGFETGFIVPSGYYDRDKGTWIASENGIVVELLDTDNDGLVDSVDSDGDGFPDDLNNNGDISDEASGLSDPQVYQPGTSYMRVQVTHFTPWDYNSCTQKSLLNLFGYERPTLADQPCPDCPQSSTGSSVGNDSLIFYENIAIPGTGLSLAYASDRTEGFKNLITVPVTGSTVHPEVKRIIVELEIAGQKLKKTLQPTPNQVTELVWDGLDWLGNRVFHKVTAHVRIGYVYDSKYMNSAYLRMSFAEFGTTLTTVPSREEVINWQRSDLTVNVADKSHGLARGWSISAHHRMNPTDPSTLHKGDGSVAKNITTVITTIAGNGRDGWPLDGASALDTPIGHPTSVAMDGKGNLYVANQVYSAILKIDKDGVVEVIAGGSQGISEEDDIDAKSAMLQIPDDIAFDAKGNLYIADAGANKIRKIDPQGIITTLAGNGNAESSGDNGPAIDAGIMPSSVAVDDFGNVYFTEGTSCVGGSVDSVTGKCIGGQVVEGSYRVRKVSTNGMISTIVGTGEKYDRYTHASNGDNGPASDAYLQNPTSVSLDQDGNLYIADGPRIRKVNASGYITTVAGNGYTGYTGDGGLATDAQITQASGVTFDKSGNFYFSQYYGNGDVIRKVTGTGYISTVAGKGEPGMDGDNGPATHALLKQPQRLAIDPNGFIYIPDKGNGLIRMVSTDAYSNKEIRFTESSGWGHLISAEGFHTSTYDLETGTNLLTFAYDGQKKLTSITDQLGNVVTIERLAGIPSAIISPDGMRTEITLDSNRQLTRMTLPDLSTYDFEYDHNNGLLTAKNEPNGNRFEHYFDGNGRITLTNDLEGGLWEFSKTKTHDGKTTSRTMTENTLTTVTKVSRSSGEVKTTLTAPTGDESYTLTAADGLLSTSWTPCGIKTTSISDLDRMYGYIHLKEKAITTPAGLVLKTDIGRAYVDSDFNGIPELMTETITTNDRVTTRTHDVTNARQIITSPENRAITTTYDPATLLTLKSEVAGLYPAEYSYFADGKLSSETTGDRTTHYTYDLQGNLATITDPQNKVTRFTDYDALGRITRMEQADGSILAYDYDENGNMTLLTTPVPADHLFDYNGVNKPSTQTTPLNSITQYAYNEERLLTSITLPSGKAIHNTYVNGQLTETATDEWTNLYAYTCGNLPASITRGPEEIGYEYDGTLVTASFLTGTLDQTLEFVYNNDFSLTAFTYAGATEVFEYDNDGLVTGTGRFSITRNPDNGLPEQVSDNTFILARSFNGYGEAENVTTRISGSTRLGYTLTRDHNGRTTTRDLTVSGTNHTYDYTYDDFGRLLTVTEDGIPTEEYEYDNNGNRIYEINTHLGITGRTLTYSIEDYLITTDTATYEFDPDDRLSKVTEGSDITDYVYSSTGELVSVTLPDGTEITYVHDPLGRRIAKKNNGTIVEKYLWSGQTTLLAVFDGNDNLLQRFEYGDGRMPCAMTANGNTYYLAYDQVGTLRLVTDTAGVAIKQIDYDSFGNIIVDTNPSFTIPFGFAGGLHDRDTDLVRFGYRDYMPKTGKWTAKDPIGFAGGDSNLYGYVLNDPVNFIDPTGESGLPGLIIGIVAGAYGGFTAGMASGNIKTGILSGIIGGIAGGFVGVVHPGLSAKAGGIIGGIVGGIAGGVSGVYKDDSCKDPTFRDYANAAVFGGVVGGVTGAIGGYTKVALNSVRVTGVIADITASMIAAPVELGLSIGASSITE